MVLSLLNLLGWTVYGLGRTGDVIFHHYFYSKTSTCVKQENDPNFVSVTVNEFWSATACKNIQCWGIVTSWDSQKKREKSVHEKSDTKFHKRRNTVPFRLRDNMNGMKSKTNSFSLGCHFYDQTKSNTDRETKKRETLPNDFLARNKKLFIQRILLRLTILCKILAILTKFPKKCSYFLVRNPIFFYFLVRNFLISLWEIFFFPKILC